MRVTSVKLRVPINQRGVALGIVVWFIAGMSLLVSGIIAEARVDTRLAQLHYAKAKAAAAGDGAIHLALAEQLARKQNKQKGADRRRELQIGGNIVAIRMIPSGLLVNISTEAVKGLTALFSMAQGRSQGDTRRWRLSPEQPRQSRGSISRRCEWSQRQSVLQFGRLTAGTGRGSRGL